MSHDPLEGVRPPDSLRPAVSFAPPITDGSTGGGPGVRVVVLALAAVIVLIAAGMGFYFATNWSAKAPRTPRAASTAPASSAQGAVPTATPTGETVVKQGPRPADPSPKRTPPSPTT